MRAHATIIILSGALVICALGFSQLVIYGLDELSLVKTIAISLFGVGLLYLVSSVMKLRRAEVHINIASNKMLIGAYNGAEFKEKTVIDIGRIQSIFIQRNKLQPSRSELKVRLAGDGGIVVLFTGDINALEVIHQKLVKFVRIGDERRRARTTRTANFLATSFN